MAFVTLAAGCCLSHLPNPCERGTICSDAGELDGGIVEANACRSGTIRTVAGNSGALGFAGDGAPAGPLTSFFWPFEALIARDTTFVVDWGAERVRSWGPDGIARTIAGNGRCDLPREGASVDTSVCGPTDVAADRDGTLIVDSCWVGHSLWRVDPLALTIRHVAGVVGDRDISADFFYSGDGGPATEAMLELPSSVAFGLDGNLLVLDAGNQVIRRIDGTGTITRFAGRCIVGGCAPGEEPVPCAGSDKEACGLDLNPNACSDPCPCNLGGDGGPALEIRMCQPSADSYRSCDAGGLAVGADGAVFFTDPGNNRVRRIGPDGIVTTVAGSGRRWGPGGYAGDGGRATEARLNWPTDVEIAPDGTLYIADEDNSCIRCVDPAGIIGTFAGRCGEHGFSGDGGPATQALLYRPHGIALDSSGNLYIADTLNGRIRVVTP